MAVRAATRSAPVVRIRSQKLTSDTGDSASDLVTGNGAVTLTGTVTVGSGTVVKIYDGATFVGTATVDRRGNWKFSGTLPDGTHALRAVATNAYGLSASTPDQPSIVVDTSTPVVAFRYESQIVGSNTVNLWGTVTGSAGTRVEVFSGGVSLGFATVTGDSWHLETPELAAGNYSFSAVATTVAGRSATFSGIPSLTVGQVSGTLDLGAYHTVWQQDFTTTSEIDRDIFPIVYGDPHQFSFGPNGLTLTSYRQDGFSNVGILQPNWSPELSQGYGLYSITCSAPAGQGAGIAVLLWPTNNVWPGAEIDILENWSDTAGQTGYMSVHFRGPNGEDMANSIQFSVNLTVPNTFALDWRHGSLTYYINGNMIFQITGSEVPLDYAHGGLNAAFGAQVTDIGDSYQPGDTVSLTIESMSYSALNSVADLLGTGSALTSGALEVSPDVQAAADLLSLPSGGAMPVDAAGSSGVILSPLQAATPEGWFEPAP